MLVGPAAPIGTLEMPLDRLRTTRGLRTIDLEYAPTPGTSATCGKATGKGESHVCVRAPSSTRSIAWGWALQQRRIPHGRVVRREGGVARGRSAALVDCETPGRAGCVDTEPCKCAVQRGHCCADGARYREANDPCSGRVDDDTAHDDCALCCQWCRCTLRLAAMARATDCADNNSDDKQYRNHCSNHEHAWRCWSRSLLRCRCSNRNRCTRTRAHRSK